MVLAGGAPEVVLSPLLAVLESGQTDWSLPVWEDPFLRLFISMMIGVSEPS